MQTIKYFKQKKENNVVCLTPHATKLSYVGGEVCLTSPFLPNKLLLLTQLKPIANNGYLSSKKQFTRE